MVKLANMTENNLIEHTETLTKKDFGHICRCCLFNSKRNTMDNIFQSKFDEIFLVDMFKLFGFQVNSSDDLPKTICASCTTSVINFYNFKKMYDNSVATLQIISQDSYEVPENKELPLETYQNHKILPLEEDVENVEKNEFFKEELDEESNNENNEIEKIDESIDQENINNSTASTGFKGVQKSNSSKISPKFTLPYFCKTCNKWIIATGTHKHSVPRKVSYKQSVPRKGSHVCEKCGKSYLQKAALEIHYRIHKLKLLAINKDNDEKGESNSVTEETTKKRKICDYQCSCNETFHSAQDLIQHKKEKNHQDPLYKNCEICNKTITYKGYMKHMRITHSPHTEEAPFTCEYCESTFKFKSNLKRHIQMHIGENFACEYCESTFKNKGNLERHIKIHTGEKPHVCEFCGKGFIQKNTLDDHRRVHTGEKPFICDFCEKGFAQRMALKNHRRSHTGEKPFLCDNCGKTFRSKVAYNNHLKGKHQDKLEIQCKICNNFCSSETALKLHMIRHGEKKYNCTQCTKDFHTKKELDSHFITHTIDKKVVCDLCGKSFKHSFNLKVHMRIHTGLKPYKCKICYKAFRRNGHLVSHMRVHTGEKPFICPYCDKTFAHLTNRVEHVRSHTGEKPYVCDVCSKEFYRSSSMAKHRQSHLKNDVGIKLQESA